MCFFCGGKLFCKLLGFAFSRIFFGLLAVFLFFLSGFLVFGCAFLGLLLGKLLLLFFGSGVFLLLRHGFLLILRMYRLNIC